MTMIGWQVCINTNSWLELLSNSTIRQITM